MPASLPSSLLGRAYDTSTALALRTALVANRGVRRSAEPFDDGPGLVPHTERRGAAWCHNGLMLPSLPEPLRFLSITTVVGGAGVRIADLATPPPGGDARNRALAGVATAVSGFAGDYAIDADCELAPDGSRWRYGAELTLSGRYPDVRVQASTPDLRVDLAVTASPVASWFIDLPSYRHLSLQSRYEGTIEHAGTRYDVEGLGCYEYACAPGLGLLTGRALPRAARLPVDFFTYQVLDLGDGLQLLLVATRAAGRTLLNSAHLRDTTGRSLALTRGVDFELLEHRPEPAVTPDDGHPMPLPHRFRWRTPVGSPVEVDLVGTTDTPFQWGLAAGYVDGFRFSGMVDGRAVAGTSGYVEWIDRR